MRAPLSVLLLAACASPPEPPPAQPDALTVVPRAPTITADDRGCDAPGPRLRATDDGILLDDGTRPAQSLTVARGRHLRLTGDTLYFFDPTRPTLHTLDLEFRGLTRHVLELPPLEHPGFASPDPLAFLQRQEDLDITGDILCMDLHDRPADPTLTYNLRVDLASATVERRLVEDLTGDRCGAEREAVRPRLCTPAGPSTQATQDGLCVPIRLTTQP